MFCSNRNVVIVMFCIAIGGCDQGILKSPEGNLAQISGSLQSTIIDQQKNLLRARVAFLDNARSLSDNDADFVGFVCCLGPGWYSLQRAAFATIGGLTDAYTAAYAAPSSDISTLFSDVFKREALSQ